MTKVEKLEGLCQEIDALIAKGVLCSTPEFKAWKIKALRFLSHTFGEDSTEVKAFKETKFAPGCVTTKTTRSEFVTVCVNGLKTTRAIFVDYLDEFKEEKALKMSISDETISASKKVFIIHGHNEAKRRELKDLLENKFGLETIVLGEQPNQGLTIIEKFEKYASCCGYAFALFTPDDIIINGEEQYFQARPNVIFELGWFYSRLGRNRVCILDQASEKSEIFSDLHGVMRIQFNDAISDKYLEIEKELKSAGLL